MFRNYFKIAWRNLLKNRIFSIVNISGLAIGMAACFFIFEYVHFESSYDRYHKDAADIYRVNISFGGSFANLTGMSTNHPAVGPAMKKDFPEVKEYARVVPVSLFVPGSTVSYTNAAGNKVVFNEEKVYLADQSFLGMFDVSFIAGDRASALTSPKSVAISETTAEKYFGKENPIGKTLMYNRTLPLQVTGVFHDVPENSHIRFNMLVSMKLLGDDFGTDQWGWPEWYSYIRLAPGTDPKKIEARFPAFIEKYLAEKERQFSFKTYFHLQRLTDIHLRSGQLKGPEPTGSESEIYFLSIIGIFLLVIAWINYVNLSTAKSVERAKEIGLRKVVGAIRRQVIFQFIMESVITNLAAVVLAALIVLALFPYFGAFIGKNLGQGSETSNLWHAPRFWLALAGIFVVGAFVVGAYPAFILSAYRPSVVLKGRFFQSAKGILMRKALVSFQFVLSILLIAGTVTVYRQLSFMQDQSLGYNKDQIVVVKTPQDIDSTFQYKVNSFKAQLLADPSIAGVAGSTDIPGQQIGGRNNIRRASEDKSHNFITAITNVDEQFLPTFQMRIVAGRNFSIQDSSTIDDRVRGDIRLLVNEEVVHGLGFKNNDDAIHQKVMFSYGPGELHGEIVGVVQNYHQRGLREKYDPVLYLYPSYSPWSYFSVHVDAQLLQKNLASINKVYKDLFPGRPFQYFFLNEYFNRQYQADERFGKVFGTFTILAIFIACLGLLGLSSFVIRTRTKEIGIRKVLGATGISIVTLFSKDFVRLVLLASVIAVPVIWFMAGRWLQDYAFHIQLGWLVFILPPLLLLAMSLITIGIQSLRAGAANPVKNLRTE